MVQLTLDTLFGSGASPSPTPESGPQSPRGYAMPALSQQFSVVLDCLVCDVSGSMGQASFQPGMSRLRMLCEACKRYLDVKLESRPNDHVAVVAYSSDASVLCPFQQVGAQYNTLANAVQAMQRLPHGGTNMATGLRSASGLLGQSAETIRQFASQETGRVLTRVIAYSDGHDQNADEGTSLAHALKEQGVLFETFGIAPSPEEVDEPFLKRVATTDAFTHYRFLGDAEAVYQTFEQVADGTLVYEG